MQYSCTHVYRAAGSERSASGREITWERYSDACGRRAAQCALQQHGGLHVAAGRAGERTKVLSAGCSRCSAHHQAQRHIRVSDTARERVEAAEPAARHGWRLLKRRPPRRR